VDAELVVVGSFNLAFACHPEPARRLREEHDRLADPSRSCRLGLDGRRTVSPDGAGARACAWRRESGASLGRRPLAHAVGWLPVESQL
jgi:putative cardiolipin synthase